jgi:hypothetical protein
MYRSGQSGRNAARFPEHDRRYGITSFWLGLIMLGLAPISALLAS